MKKTKIDWCDCTVNPVKGCKNGCKYCYARKMNDRFHYVKNWNEPQFFPKVLEQFKNKKRKSVFIDSMSDIGCWEDEWLEQAFKAMAENPQHNYIALTKCDSSKIIKKIFEWSKRNDYTTFNLWVGQSITTQAQVDFYNEHIGACDFLSVEPLLEPIDLVNIINRTATVIIGAETGNRKGKAVPEKEWVQDIVELCNENDIKVFMKESLRGIMGEDFRQDTLSWEVFYK